MYNAWFHAGLFLINHTADVRSFRSVTLCSLDRELNVDRNYFTQNRNPLATRVRWVGGAVLMCTFNMARFVFVQFFVLFLFFVISLSSRILPASQVNRNRKQISLLEVQRFVRLSLASHYATAYLFLFVCVCMCVCCSFCFAASVPSAVLRTAAR